MNNIIVDVDDVTLDWTAEMSEFVGVDLTNTSKRIHECLDITFEEEVELIKTFNSSEKFGQLSLKPGAKEGIELLKSNFNIHFVTSCGASFITKQLRTQQLSSLFGNDVNFTFLDVHEPKNNVILDIKPIIIIDDNFDNVSFARLHGARGYLFDAPWSRNKEKTYIWSEINEHLNSF
jgi:hypothetical protein